MASANDEFITASFDQNEVRIMIAAVFQFQMAAHRAANELAQKTGFNRLSERIGADKARQAAGSAHQDAKASDALLGRLRVMRDD